MLLFASPLLIYVPPVQQWLVSQTAKKASEATGLDIGIERVSLRFPLDLSVEGVTVVRQSDTIASVGRAIVDVKLLPLLGGEVAVDELTVEDADINTLDLISDVQVSGRVGRLSVDPGKIHFGTGSVDLSGAALTDADVTVLLSDTAQVDTADTGPTPWRITFDQLSVERSKVGVHLPGDSMLIGVDAGLLLARGGDLNLLTTVYEVAHTEWHDGRLVFDQPFEPAVRDMAHPDLLDYSHLDIGGIDWSVDSFLYQAPIIRLKVNHAAMHDVSGLDITDLKGDVTIDDHSVILPALSLKTPYSSVAGKAYVDFTVADSVNPGQMSVDLDASVSKHDLSRFVGLNMDPLPEWPLTLKGSMAGNTAHATIIVQRLSWPTVLEVEGTGVATHLTDANRLSAELAMRVDTYDTRSLLTALMDGRKPSFAIPSGLRAQGRFTAHGPLFTGNIAARQGDGTTHVTGSFNRATMTYDAELTTNRLNMRQLLPGTKLRTLNARATVHGQGTDFFSPSARLDAQGTISHLGYDTLNIDDIALKAYLKDGHLMADLSACNDLMDVNASLDATLERPSVIIHESNVSVQKLDLYALGLIDKPLTIGLNGDFEMSTNLSDTHRLSGLMTDIYLRDSVRTYHPEKVGLLLKALPDTTVVRAQSGTLVIKLDAQGHYEPLLGRLSTLGDTIASQLERRVIDQASLKRLLPTARFYLSSQQGNPMANMLKAALNTDFKDLMVDLTTSPRSGLNGEMSVLGLNADSTRIDTIRVTLVDKPNHGLTFQARVANNRKNPQFVFTALMDGLLQEHGASVGLRFFDSHGNLGLRLGAKAEMEEGGMRFHLLPQRPTIGYREFTLNADNFLFLQNNLRLQAKVDLLADDGTGVRVYSSSQDSTLLQDLTVSLHHFDLGRLTSALPYVPYVTGLLDGDYHLTMDGRKRISVASDMGVTDMTYEGSEMGSLQTEFVYLQREDDTHAIDGTLLQNGREIAVFQGDYRNKKVTDGHEHLDGKLTLLRAPLNLVNGFIPDQLLGLEGYAEGDLSVVGSLDEPDVNGEVFVDSAFLVSQPYGVRLRFDNDPVRIQQSKILLENFTMYGNNDDTPLNIQGNIDFHDLSDMTMDVRMRASNLMLINTKRTPKSLAYGKAYVNFMAVMRGPLDRLRMRGKLDVLGTTDLTYLLLDSPLSTDNQLDELVKFTDFSDTTATAVVRKPTPQGLDMILMIGIAQSAHVKCGLNADESNFVDLMGGGDLRLTYNSTEALRLTGRYTLSNGAMKYSLPVIPLKTFNIQEGSYVEFTGDMMNPTLNITATERNNASVGEEGMQTRTVVFDCGVVITRTLSDMGLEFIIKAPDDAEVTSELNAMSAEQRSRSAVTMLTTGMYLSDGNTSGFSMNSALSNFLEKEINTITGNALKTVDLSVGLDNNTDAAGTTHTDYSFKFAKRFWNNRLKVQIGGKVSSGTEVQGQKQSFFDNVSMEYRLSPTSNQYVKLFYNQNVYDWLEGYTSEYGGGYIWRRKLDSLLDIFRKTPSQPAMEPRMNMRRTERTDSLQTSPKP